MILMVGSMANNADIFPTSPRAFAREHEIRFFVGKQARPQSVGAQPKNMRPIEQDHINFAGVEQRRQQCPIRFDIEPARAGIDELARILEAIPFAIIEVDANVGIYTTPMRLVPGQRPARLGRNVADGDGVGIGQQPPHVPRCIDEYVDHFATAPRMIWLRERVKKWQRRQFDAIVQSLVCTPHHARVTNASRFGYDRVAFKAGTVRTSEGGQDSKKWQQRQTARGEPSTSSELIGR